MKEKESVKGRINRLKTQSMGFINGIISNPSFNVQMALILLTLTSENVRMDRRINNMSASIEKIRNVNEVISSSIQSLRMIADLPKNVKRIIE